MLYALAAAFLLAQRCFACNVCALLYVHCAHSALVTALASGARALKHLYASSPAATHRARQVKWIRFLKMEGLVLSSFPETTT